MTEEEHMSALFDIMVREVQPPEDASTPEIICNLGSLVMYATMRYMLRQLGPELGRSTKSFDYVVLGYIAALRRIVGDIPSPGDQSKVFQAVADMLAELA